VQPTITLPFSDMVHSLLGFVARMVGPIAPNLAAFRRVSANVDLRERVDRVALTDLDVAAREQLRRMLPAKQRADDSAGPEVDALASVLGDLVVADDVGELEAATRAEHTIDLGEHRLLVRDEVDDAVGDHDVDRLVRERQRFDERPTGPPRSRAPTPLRAFARSSIAVMSTPIVTAGPGHLGRDDHGAGRDGGPVGLVVLSPVPLGMDPVVLEVQEQGRRGGWIESVHGLGVTKRECGHRVNGTVADRLRALPSVDRLATAVARAELAERRAELLAGARDEVDLVARARGRLRPSLRRVLNATGVIVHTNLGRAPLAPAARAAVARAAEGYCNVELDLAAGGRASRHDHVEALLRELTGAEAAAVVNNCAAAVLLGVSALVRPGREVVVSRGQLIEIGGGFRMPDVVAQAGACLVEVGTTNRTRLADYESVLGPETGAILRAHPSNFRSIGFVEEVEVEALCRLEVPVIDDIGSGVLADDLAVLAGEPVVRRSVKAGAAVVTFSGDKLLGGPQAGILVGSSAAIGACRHHPLARAVRIDKLSLAALEATLQLYRDPALALRELPVLAMLTLDEGELDARANRLAAATGGEVIGAVGRVGGGALPLLELPGPVVALDPGPAGADALAASLRAGDPAVVGRIEHGRVLLDPRTLAPDEVDAAAEAVVAVRG
jgi:L-seryl-tRNA(Ser) seleniumtransferase